MIADIFMNETGITTPIQGSGAVQTSWYLFILVLILGGITVGLILVMLSKNPKDWRHHSLLLDTTQKGNMKYLAESIKILSVDHEGYAPVRGLMKRLFYEKIKSLRSLSVEEEVNLFRNDQATLQKYVTDPELTNWLLDVRKKGDNDGLFDFFRKEKGVKKEKYMMEFMKMLEKMEKWGT